MNQQAAAFDSAAADYDTTFTHSAIGRLQRERLYHWLESIQFFAQPLKVFEVNCGTGYDAEQFHERGHEVVATDASPAMIDEASAKRKSAIRFFPMRFEEMNQQDELRQSDVLFSNFGGLNCLSEKGLEDFFAVCRNQQSSGDLIIAVLMPRFCFMESLYFFLKGNWNKLFRRNTSEAVVVPVDGTLVPTFYHSPRKVKQMLRPNYNIRLSKALSICLPPSYMEPYFQRHKGQLKRLMQFEQFLGKFTSMSAWADHYVLIAEKK